MRLQLALLLVTLAAASVSADEFYSGEEKDFKLFPHFVRIPLFPGEDRICLPERGEEEGNGGELGQAGRVRERV